MLEVAQASLIGDEKSHCVYFGIDIRPECCQQAKAFIEVEAITSRQMGAALGVAVSGTVKAASRMHGMDFTITCV